MHKSQLPSARSHGTIRKMKTNWLHVYPHKSILAVCTAEQMEPMFTAMPTLESVMEGKEGSQEKGKVLRKEDKKGSREGKGKEEAGNKKEKREAVLEIKQGNKGKKEGSWKKAERQ